jgi:crotonobetainyl-CoA:carnitine CoA-transferase CaiB-like acyl-CoA transferase
MVSSPLSGVTVVDLTINLAGPFASQVLRDLGARVIKVEPPAGDDSRTWPPYVDGVATVFAAFNRGKESVVIDAKRPEGRELLHALVKRADVFLESLRPGKAAALGLAWEDLEPLNPRLVYCSVNAFGDEGPMSGAPGFDAIVQAYSGIMDLTGHPDGDPSRVGAAMIDVGTGMWAAIAILAALSHPDPDRRGGRVQATMLGTAVSFLQHHLAAVRLAGSVPTRLGTAQHNFAPYQAVHTRDRLVMVGVNSDRMWQRFCAAVEDDGRLGDDPRFAGNAARIEHRDALIGRIEELTSRLGADELVERLSASGIPASAVRPVNDLADDPQLSALGLWGVTDEGHPLPRIPVDAAGAALGAIPRLGQHTAQVLAELDAHRSGGLESRRDIRLSSTDEIL